MAKANEYQILDMFHCRAGLDDLSQLRNDIRDIDRLAISHYAAAGPADERITCYNVHAVLRKTVDTPFRCGLEVATAHAQVSDAISARYGQWHETDPLNVLRRERDAARAKFEAMREERDAAAVKAEAMREERDGAAVKAEAMRQERDAAMALRDHAFVEISSLRSSTSWRITTPLRYLGSLAKGQGHRRS
jgi:hypothetical protein